MPPRFATSFHLDSPGDASRGAVVSPRRSPGVESCRGPSQVATRHPVWSRALLALVLVLVPAFAAQAQEMHVDAASGLEYLEIVTGGAADNDPLPVVVAIHGLGDRPESFRLLLDDMPARARLIVPKAPMAWHADGFSWFDFHNDDDEGASALGTGVRVSAERLAHLIESLTRQHGAPPRAVVCGFSQGGMLSFALAAMHPELVAAAVPVSGYLPQSLWPAERPKTRPLPKITALHGEADPLIPLESVRWTVEALRSNGYDVSVRSWPGVGHALSHEMRAALITSVVGAVEQISLPGTVQSGPPVPQPWEEREEPGSRRMLPGVDEGDAPSDPVAVPPAAVPVPSAQGRVPAEAPSAP